MGLRILVQLKGKFVCVRLVDQLIEFFLSIT